ncbi:MAG: SDR family NAD(P)-dependent oxidoreductase [Bacteroidales bacterium]|nr:SDR family NAD(P)-dependent oxidoreductase [Bacteroidales bacterium]
MNFNLQHKTFMVGGATAGFGLAIANALLNEGAGVIAIARNQKPNNAFINSANLIFECGDLFDHDFHDYLLDKYKKQNITGALINAGGPPAGTFEQLGMADWDTAYNAVIAWKVHFLQKLAAPYET